MISEPNFVYMDLVPESSNNPDGDDDKVYLFFSENAMEYDFYNKLTVSRVARVCKVATCSKCTFSCKKFHWLIHGVLNIKDSMCTLFKQCRGIMCACVLSLEVFTCLTRTNMSLTVYRGIWVGSGRSRGSGRRS